MKKTILLVSISISLFGCGSDDSRPGVKPGIPSPPNTSTTPSVPKPPKPPTDTVEPPAVPDDKPNEAVYELVSGIYDGVTGQNEIAEGLVDDKKRLWVIYSDNDSDGDVLGFVNTNENIIGNNGEFSVKGKNYSYYYRNAFDTTVTGDYKTSKVLKGQIFDVPVRSTTYKVDYNEALSAKKQSLASINNRTFTGIAYITGDTGEGELVIDVHSNGVFTGEDESRCKMTGKFTPSTSQRYFESTVTFGGAPCFAPRETITGVALLNENNELIVLGTDANRNKGIYFSGEEQ
ncbi:hypothetical protein [Psychrobacter okhotskensis]|uniref:hypothetical protein n=1 Tax=Psychrobacter okhotskensis TaxID=212403 RepID=UPI0019183CE0|nr:hypothetical protein [Psychrobacter okhotskensis]